MAERIYVLTHKNPDTDSICAALALSELRGYIPVACGELNSQTEYVLKKAPAPGLLFMDTLEREARDIMKPALVVKEDSLLREAIEIMRDKKIRTLPVVDRAGRLMGLVTSRVLSERALEGLKLENINGRIFFSDIAKVLGGRLLIKPEDNRIRGKFRIAAMNEKDFVKRVKRGDVVITGLREEIINSSVELGIDKFIITGQKKVGNRILQMLKKHKAGLILSRHDTFYTTHLIPFSIRIGEMMLTDIKSINETTREKEIGQLLKTVPYALSVVDDRGRVMGIISRSDYIKLPRIKVVLVDHNEFSQAIKGIEDAEILEIYDHHRLGDIQTTQPVFVRNEPLGSTCTIVYKMYKEQKKQIPRKVGLWLLAGILSDTLLLNSPTTTEYDRQVVAQLSDMLGVDYQRFGKKLIAKKFGERMENVLTIISQDFKEYNVGNKRIGISQIELIKARAYKNILKKIVSKLGEFRRSRGLDLMILMITDIYENGSFLYFDFGDFVRIGYVFEQEARQGMFVPNLFSRKKQLFPEIVNALARES